MSTDFYLSYIYPHIGIIVKICRAYTHNEEDYNDYFQEVCLQIWKSRDNFQNKSKWSTWIYRISLNVCLSLHRKEKKIQFNSSDDLSNIIDTNDKADFHDENLKVLYWAIKQLSEVDRAIILLYLEEKAYQEIAEIIGKDSNYIGVKINRIKERLKKLLDGEIN